jgi:lysophospholipase L1-like esterase
VRRRTLIALALALLAGGPEGRPLRPLALRAQQPPRLADARSGQAGGIVFVGSSIFHRWTSLSSQMAPLPITNLAFDGSMTPDMLAMANRRVIPLRPKVIAYYCGSNDVAVGEPADAIVARIIEFIERVSAALPETRIVFVSINRAPSKEDRWDVVDEVNNQMRKYATIHPHITYVDVNPVLFDTNGKPRFDLYMPDELHLRPPAYERFAKILKPVLTQALQD